MNNNDIRLLTCNNLYNLWLFFKPYQLVRYQIFVFPFPTDAAPLKLNHSFVSPVDDDEDDEPLLSGSGAVQKECSEEELGSWADLLSKWKGVSPRPKQLPGLVRKVVIQLMLSFLRCYLLYLDDNNNKSVVLNVFTDVEEIVIGLCEDAYYHYC